MEDALNNEVSKKVATATTQDARRRTADTEWYKAFGNQKQLSQLFAHTVEDEGDGSASDRVDVNPISGTHTRQHSHDAIRLQAPELFSDRVACASPRSACMDLVDDSSRDGDVADHNENIDIDEAHRRGTGEIVTDDERAADNEVYDCTDINDGVQPDDVIQLLRRRSKYLYSWSSMISLLTTCGYVRFTSVAYDVLAKAIYAASEGRKLYTYKTVNDKLRKLLLNVCYPTNEVISFCSDSQQVSSSQNIVSEESSGTGNNQEDDLEHSVRLVLPSAWAKVDIMTLPFYNNMYENPWTTDSTSMSIETSSIVKDRNGSNALGCPFWASDPISGFIRAASFGDKVRFPCQAAPQTRDGCNFDDAGWISEDGQEIEGQAGEAFVFGTVGAMWCVRAAGCETDMLTDENLLNENERRIYDMASTAAEVHTSNTSRRKQKGGKHVAHAKFDRTRAVLRPGDVCTFIRSDIPTSQGMVCVFVASFWRTNDSFPAERLVWIDANMQERGLARSVPVGVLPLQADCVVTSLPSLIRKNSEELGCNPSEKRTAPCKGKMKDGIPYVVYRMVLYADGFNASSLLFAPKSYAGIYMLPIGLEQTWRTTPASIRILSLTPPGVSKNEVLHAIISDIVHGTVHGFITKDAYGRNVRLFLDVVAFEGDYPEAAAVMDTLGHASNSPCTLCNFRKVRNGRGSQNGYTNEVHSKRLAFARFSQRVDQLRMSGISSDDARFLGLKPGNMQVSATYPTVALSNELARVRNVIPRTSHDIPVVSSVYDTYLNNIVAPDHLLSGLAHDLLLLCFSELRSNEERSMVDADICGSLSDNGLPAQRSLIRKDGTLHGLSMTSTFCVLMSATVIFSRYTQLRDEDCFKLLQQLQTIVAEVYWWPTVHVDGKLSVAYATEDGGSNYYASLRHSAMQYITGVNDLSKRDSKLGGQLDKPNLHRLLELVTHSIPLCKHARNISEMPFELFHQGLKGVLKSNSRRNTHLTAVEHSIANDWQGRLRMLYHYSKKGNESQKRASLLGLRRLILGEEAVCTVPNDERFEQVARDFEEKLDEVFEEPVKSLLGKGGRVNNNWCDEEKRWEGAMAGIDDNCSTALSFGKKVLRDVYGSYSVKNDSMKAYASVKLLQNSTLTGDRRAFAYNSIRPGNALRALVWPESATNTVVECTEDGQGEVVMFVVSAIMGCDDHEIWVVVLRMDQAGEYFSVGDNDYSLLRMGKSVRRVALFHDCDGDCVWTRGKKVHSAKPLEGGRYKIVDRRGGYPPHMG